MNTKPKKRLSIDELKSYAEFENFTDEMAEETIASLEALSILFYELHQKSILERKKLKALLNEKE